VLQQEGEFREFWLEDKGNASCILHWTGDRRYGGVVARAFPSVALGGIAKNVDVRYGFRVALTGCGQERISEIEDFLCLLIGRINILDGLTECYALDYHKRPGEGGMLEHTVVGKTVRRAKPYDMLWNRGSRDAADVIADWMAEFMTKHPAYARAENVVSVPPSNPEKEFDLPAYVAETVASRTGKKYNPALRKTRITRQMKDASSVRAKMENIRGAFEAEGAVDGTAFILIDDIYEGGYSMNEAARVLFAAGAEPVFGLVATKTWREV
jgi:hypothetical protein